MAVLADPALRGALTARGTDGGDDTRRGALARFDWITADGAVDQALLRSTADGLGALLTPTAVLGFDRIDPLPVREDERHRVSATVLHTVSERLGRRVRVPEPVLNAAIAMFALDVSTVRRDGVDMGLLIRTADGSSYVFAEDEGGPTTA